MLRRLAIAASALAGVPLAIAWVVCDQVLHPKPRVEDNSLDNMPLPAQPIAFPSRDGTRLAGWFIPSPDSSRPGPAIVLSHGWARSRCELLPHANFLHRAGFAVLMFDYRNRGESQGTAITMCVRERGDLLGALDTLCARPEVDATRVGIFGMSMGGVLSILVTAHDERIRAITVEAPYASQRAIMGRALRHYFKLPTFPVAHLARWWFRLRVGAPLDGVDAVDFVGNISPRPIFVMACENDAVIGSDETERVFEAAREPKRFWFIQGADHARGWQTAPDEYERRVTEFFQRALMPQESQPATSDAAS